jgi:hypothetical protein
LAEISAVTPTNLLRRLHVIQIREFGWDVLAEAEFGRQSLSRRKANDSGSRDYTSGLEPNNGEFLPGDAAELVPSIRKIQKRNAYTNYFTALAKSYTFGDFLGYST